MSSISLRHPLESFDELINLPLHPGGIYVILNFFDTIIDLLGMDYNYEHIDVDEYLADKNMRDFICEELPNELSNIINTYIPHLTQRYQILRRRFYVAYDDICRSNDPFANIKSLYIACINIENYIVNNCKPKIIETS